MTREELIARRNELNKNILLMQGALLQVNEWMAKLDKEEGAKNGANPAPLTRKKPAK